MEAEGRVVRKLISFFSARTVVSATRCADAFHLAPQSDEDLACLWDMMNAQVTHGMQKIALNVKAVARVANTWVYENVNVR